MTLRRNGIQKLVVIEERSIGELMKVATKKFKVKPKRILDSQGIVLQFIISIGKEITEQIIQQADQDIVFQIV